MSPPATPRWLHRLPVGPHPRHRCLRGPGLRQELRATLEAGSGSPSPEAVLSTPGRLCSTGRPPSIPGAAGVSDAGPGRPGSAGEAWAGGGESPAAPWLLLPAARTLLPQV